MKLTFGLLNIAKNARLKTRPVLVVLMALGFTVIGSVYAASDLKSVINAEKSKLKVAQNSQAKVEGLESERRKLYDEYKAVLKEIEGLKVYHRQLSTQIRNQIKEMERIDSTIEGVTVTQRQIGPLMERMIDGLEQFIALDIPFFKDARESRIATLKSILGRSDVSTAEKFTHVIEAYKVENEYGTLIDQYKGTREVDGVNREVEYLKVGRISWSFLTLDGKYAARYNQQTGDWEELEGSYRSSIRDGLKIAKKQLTPNLFIVPVNAPESVK